MTDEELDNLLAGWPESEENQKKKNSIYRTRSRTTKHFGRRPS
jgi:hypothetical protein